MSKRKLTYEDFKRYLFNRQKSEEKHQFEKKMMQDAFDEEAFDGLSMLSEEELEQDIASIKNKIGKRTKKRHKTIPLYFRYAAGIAILIGIGLTSLYIFDSKLKNDLQFAEPVHETMALTDSAPPDEEKMALEHEMAETTSKKKALQKTQEPEKPAEQPKKVIDELKVLTETDEFTEVEILEDDLDIQLEEEKTRATEEEPEEETFFVMEEQETPLEVLKETETQSKSRMEEKDDKALKRKKRLFRRDQTEIAKSAAVNQVEEDFTSSEMPESQGFTLHADQKAMPPNNWSMDTLESRLITELRKRFELAEQTYKIEMVLTIDKQGQIERITHKKEIPENLSENIETILKEFENWKPAIKEGKREISEVTLKFMLQ